MKTIYTLTGILIFSICISMKAQMFTISGIVTDSEENPLPGVSIVIKNTSTGTVTDIDGKFSLQAENTEFILVFSYIGYVTQEVEVNPSMNTLKVTLLEDVVTLDEVVVIGYGTVKKCEMTGAVSSIDYSSVGSAAGVSSRSTPGIRVRGSRSISKSSAIYGSRGSEEYDTKASETTGNYSKINGGILTAGEVNDFSKWELWKDIAANKLDQYQQIWKMKPIDRYTVQVKTENNLPVIGAEVKMVKGPGKIMWSTLTDNTGKAELWYSPFGQDSSVKKISAIVEFNGLIYPIEKLNKFHEGVNTLVIPQEFSVPENVDIAFVVDATSSMSDEINYLKSELLDIMSRAKDTLKKSTLNLSTVFYRDYGDSYVTIMSDFSSDISKSIDFIKNNNAEGGNDYPEAVHEALNVTVNKLSWSKDALARIVFLIMDAPPHEDVIIVNQLTELTQTAAEKGIRIVPVTCSGVDKSTEYLMRCIALLTNGTYTFLTDDSGVGGSHIKPTTDKYDVEKMNGLVLRLIYQYTHIPEMNEQLTDNEKDTLIVEKPETIIADEDTTTQTERTDRKNTSEKIEKEEIGWKYYPNPTDGIIHIESEIEMGEIYVCDLSGKILQRNMVKSSNEFMLDISQYPSGIYFICYEYEKDKWLKGKLVLWH